MAKHISASSFLIATAIAAGGLAGCASPDHIAVTSLTGPGSQVSGGKVNAVLIPLDQRDDTRIAAEFDNASVYVDYLSNGQGVVSAVFNKKDYVEAAVVFGKNGSAELTDISFYPTSWKINSKEFPREHMDMYRARAIATDDLASDSDRRILPTLEALQKYVGQLPAAAQAAYNNLPNAQTADAPTDTQAICDMTNRTAFVSVKIPEVGYARGTEYDNSDHGQIDLYTNQYTAHADMAGNQEIRLFGSEVNAMHINAPGFQIDQVGNNMVVTKMIGDTAGKSFALDYKPGKDQYSNLAKQFRDAFDAVNSQTSGACHNGANFKGLLMGKKSGLAVFEKLRQVRPTVQTPYNFLYPYRYYTGSMTVNYPLLSLRR